MELELSSAARDEPSLECADVTVPAAPSHGPSWPHQLLTGVIVP